MHDKVQMHTDTTADDWVWMVLKNPRMQHVGQVGLKWKKKRLNFNVYWYPTGKRKWELVTDSKMDNKKVCFWI